MPIVSDLRPQDVSRWLVGRGDASVGSLEGPSTARSRQIDGDKRRVYAALHQAIAFPAVRRGRTRRPQKPTPREDSLAPIRIADHLLEMAGRFEYTAKRIQRDTVSHTGGAREGMPNEGGVRVGSSVGHSNIQCTDPFPGSRSATAADGSGESARRSTYRHLPEHRAGASSLAGSSGPRAAPDRPRYQRNCVTGGICWY